MLKAILVLLAAALTCAAGTARAQESSPPANLRGLHVGFDPIVVGTLSSDYVTAGRIVSGGGLQLRVGWGFTERISIAMDVSVTKLAVADTASYDLSNGDILLRYTPRTFTLGRRTIAPYVGVGFGLRDIIAEAGESPQAPNYYELAGEVFAFSAGASIYFKPNLSIFVAYHGGIGDFNDERVGLVTTHRRELPGTSHRAAVGLTWHQGRRR